MNGVRAGLVMLALAIMACGGDGTGPANNGGGGGGGGGNTCASTSTDVTVNNNNFSPSCTTVGVGAQVTWTWGNNASNGHNVTFQGGPSSPTQTSGTFQRTFNAAGTFNYSCTVHPGMNGQIRVQ